MNKKLALLAGASVLLLGVPTIKVAHAQASGPFADVPADHWAYQSVDTLQKAGIVIGYPDHTYGGKRAMTRYEFAVAIARLLPLIPSSQGGDFATKGDLQALRSDLEAKLADNSAAIDALRQLVNGFKDELQALGQNVAEVNRRLDALEARVAAVEEEQRRVKFTGDVNFIGRADNARDTLSNGTVVPILDKNGTFTGFGGKQIAKNFDVYNDFLLNIRGKVSDTSSVNVKLDFGNFLSAVGNTAVAGAFSPPGTLNQSNQQNTVWEAYFDAPVSLGPLGGAELVVGRFPNQFSKYTLKQVDSDVYTTLYQTDSGNIPTDGAKLSLKLGPANIQGFAGKFTAIPFAQPTGGSTLVGAGQRRPGGTILEDHGSVFTQGAGTRVTFGAPEGAVLGLTAETFGLASSLTDPINGKGYSNQTVLAADFNGALPFFKSSGLTLDANYGITYNGGAKHNTGSGYRHQMTDDQLGVKFGPLSVKGGYQYIGPEYTAPGYWGKVGAWTNPTNVQGPVVSGKFAFGPKLSLNADAEFYRAAYGDTGAGVVNSPLSKDDKLTRYQVGLAYGLSSAYAVDLGYENVTYDLKNNLGSAVTGLTTSGKPVETYTTIGLGHSLNKNASVKLMYQIVDYKDKGTGFYGADARGGVAVGQFSLKF